MAFNVNTDRIIGLSAMLISLLTLFIFIYQTNIIRTQSRLSVTPRIGFTDVSDSIEDDSVVIFESHIMNKGLGPAIIESIELIHKGQHYEFDITQLFDKVYPEIYRYGEIIQSYKLSKGATLAPGERIKLYSFRARMNKVQELMNYIGPNSKTNPFEIEVVYSSIYGEQWRTDNIRDDHPTQIN